METKNLHMGNAFWMKSDVDNRARASENAKGLLHSLKISWILVHKRVKIGPEFSRTVYEFWILLRCTRRSADGTRPNFAKRNEVSGADASRIRWRRIANVNETIEARSLVFRGPKKPFYVSNGIASGGVQWQYVVNCHVF